MTRLTILGYTVRRRVCETYWNPALFPPEIINLCPEELLNTHCFVEVLIDNHWKVLDPSFQPELAVYGLPVCDWENSTLCFPVIRLYDLEETNSYQALWRNESYKEKVFYMAREFWAALDQWFAEKESLAQR